MLSSITWEEIQSVMDDAGHRYHRKYCWFCNRHTAHEDNTCLECDTEDWTDEEIEAEEDRRRNEDAQYRPVG